MDIKNHKTKDKNKEKDKKNILISGYTMGKKLGEGTFGVVYSLYDKDGTGYAVKIEEREVDERDKKKSFSSVLINEYKIYRLLKRKGIKSEIPKVYQIQTSDTEVFMIMELLGESLDVLLDRYKGKFDLGTVLLLGIDIIDIIEKIHEAGFIHRDIKPNNFLIGNESKKNKIYLTDFGLAKQYYKNNEHIEYRIDKKLTGTLRYASLNVHLGFEPSRRDDMESIGYMLVYFLTGVLPWKGIKQQYKNENMIDKVCVIKLITEIEKLCDEQCLIDYFYMCRRINYSDKPNYSKFRKLFYDTAKKKKIKLRYQWVDK